MRRGPPATRCARLCLCSTTFHLSPTNQHLRINEQHANAEGVLACSALVATLLSSHRIGTPAVQLRRCAQSFSLERGCPPKAIMRLHPIGRPDECLRCSLSCRQITLFKQRDLSSQFSGRLLSYSLLLRVPFNCVHVPFLSVPANRAFIVTRAYTTHTSKTCAGIEETLESLEHILRASVACSDFR